MLTALYEYAKQNKLLEDPDFELKGVHYVIRLRADGSFLGLEPTLMEDGKPTLFSVPRLETRTVKVSAGFLCDNTKYVLELEGNGGKAKAANLDRLKECRLAFAALAQKAAQETKDAGTIAVAAFYERFESEREKVLAQRPASEWTGAENLAFRVSGLSDGEEESTLVHLRPVVKAYFSRQRQQKTSGPAARCLVSGELLPPARLHPSIKNVPEGQSSGSALVSFNADAFTSHGLEQGENAPISQAAADGYVAALNNLLKRTPTRRFQFGELVADNSVVVYWTRDSSNRFSEDFSAFFSPSHEQGTKTIEAIRKGLAPSDLDETAFYAVTLGSNASRVVVRDWFEETVKNVKRNVAKYFADLELVGDQGEAIPLWSLLKAAESPGGQGLSPTLGARLFAAAVSGRAFPRELLAAALRRLRIPTESKDRKSLHARCALVKACLLRTPRNQERNALGAASDHESNKENHKPSYWEVSVSLDETNNRVPYLLGRLFALLERLQGAALGDINATIRDRYFGAASATPALVFPRLLRLSVHHASKADNGGWFEKLKTEVIGLMPSSGIPARLSLEEQGLFAIGYYHQRQRFFEKKEAAPGDDKKAASGDDKN